MILDPRPALPASRSSAPERRPTDRTAAALIERSLADAGPAGLTTRELLSLLLAPGRGTTRALRAADVLHERFHVEGQTGWLRSLGAADVSEVARCGIGRAAAARVLAALELGRRTAEELWQNRPCVLTPRDVYDRLHLRLRDLRQEEFWVLVLNTQREVVRETAVTRGLLNQTLIHPREVFRVAVQEAAAAVCLVHNHPSGEPTPSPEDRLVTRQLVAAGCVLGIEVLDHLIIGDGRYFSFAESGELPEGSTAAACPPPPQLRPPRLTTPARRSRRSRHGAAAAAASPAATPTGPAA